jgi:hypothetical protein
MIFLYCLLIICTVIVVICTAMLIPATKRFRAGDRVIVHRAIIDYRPGEHSPTVVRHDQGIILSRRSVLLNTGEVLDEEEDFNTDGSAYKVRKDMENFGPFEIEFDGELHAVYREKLIEVANTMAAMLDEIDALHARVIPQDTLTVKRMERKRIK